MPVLTLNSYSSCFFWNSRLSLLLNRLFSCAAAQQYLSWAQPDPRCRCGSNVSWTLPAAVRERWEWQQITCQTSDSRHGSVSLSGKTAALGNSPSCPCHHVTCVYLVVIGRGWQGRCVLCLYRTNSHTRINDATTHPLINLSSLRTNSYNLLFFAFCFMFVFCVEYIYVAGALKQGKYERTDS